MFLCLQCWRHVGFGAGNFRPLWCASLNYSAFSVCATGHQRWCFTGRHRCITCWWYLYRSCRLACRSRRSTLVFFLTLYPTDRARGGGGPWLDTAARHSYYPRRHAKFSSNHQPTTPEHPPKTAQNTLRPGKEAVRL